MSAEIIKPGTRDIYVTTCDRCGKTVDGLPPTMGVVRRTWAHLYLHTRSKAFYLCPECVEALAAWIKHGGDRGDSQEARE